jgi:hypothetical protein
MGLKPIEIADMAEVRYGADNGWIRQADFDSSLAFNFVALFLSVATALALLQLDRSGSLVAACNSGTRGVFSILLHDKLVLQALQPPHRTLP